MTRHSWYDHSFDDVYLDIYRYALSDDRSDRDAAKLIEVLTPPPGARILDLCCGQGRHAVRLAQGGYRVTGLDRSGRMIRAADRLAGRCAAKVTWAQADMRALPFAAQFDAVINMYQSFGYLENDQADQRVIDEISRVLRPGGQLLMQVANREAAIRHYHTSTFNALPNGLLVGESRSFDMMTSRLRVEYTVIRAPGVVRRIFVNRLYSLTELIAMLATAGLECRNHWATLAKEPLTLDSPQLVLLARKP